ncbi:MAG TPA: hypothetical protein VGH98_18380 [Gemmatimonadaceae bacterium]|jgi:hypothetical protein
MKRVTLSAAKALVSAVAATVAARNVGAQRPDSASVARFVAQARATTARFQDINVAIAENYVRIGPDFPAMGEHWVRGESVMRSESTPMPSILTYATIDGRRTFTGVVYTLILRAGEKAPDMPPSAEWHDHVGTIDEESLLLGHTHLGGSTDGPRLAVMHAWVWLPNPAGTFATDNWALPFARLGIPAPANASPRAARAVALPTSVPYFARLFAAVGQLDDRESDAVLDALEHSRGIVQGWLEARNPADPVSAADLARLEKIWTDLADAITHSVRPASAERLARVLDP